MATDQIPKNAGKSFWIHTSRAGTPPVINKKTGQAKVVIACKDEKMAMKVMQLLITIEPGSEIQF